MQQTKQTDDFLSLGDIHNIILTAKTQHQRIHMAAKMYAGAGIHMVPLTMNSKRLIPELANDTYGVASNDIATVSKWFSDDQCLPLRNIGMACGKIGGVFVIDVDNKDGKSGSDTLAALENEYGKLPPCPVQSTKSGGFHYFFRWREGAGSSVGRLGPGLDTRGGDAESCKGHVVVWPSSLNGPAYRWEHMAPLPEIPDWVIKLIAPVKPSLAVVNHTGGRGNENVTDGTVNAPLSSDQIKRMLDSIDPNTLEYDQWLKIGMAIKSQLDSDEGLLIWDSWSKRGNRYQEQECLRRWGRLPNSGAVTAGTLFYFAKLGGWEPDKTDTQPSGMSAIDEMVEEMNHSCALVVMGDKIRYLVEGDKYLPSNGYKLLEPTAFHMLLAHDTTPVPKGDKIIHVAKSKIWEAHQNRRLYDSGIGLFPEGNAPRGVYNTWRGFKVDPAPGDCSIFLEHVKSVICSGNDKIYNWVMDWAADMFQRPHKPKGCALVIRGDEGSGKGLFLETLGYLLGDAYKHITDTERLTHNFNAFMSNTVLLFADEAVWGRDRKGMGKLKALVTSPSLMIERKGLETDETRNLIHLAIATNEEWSIPAGMNSRRWLTLVTSNHMTGNRAYFDSIWDNLANGGRSALLHWLLNREIKSDLRSAPVTKELLRQRALASRRSTIEDFWEEVLFTGKFGGMGTFDPNDPTKTSWPEWITKAALRTEYNIWCSINHRQPQHAIVVGTILSDFGLKGTKWVKGERCYIVPPLRQLRYIYNTKFPGTFDLQDDIPITED